MFSANAGRSLASPNFYDPTVSDIYFDLTNIHRAKQDGLCVCVLF